jgi:ribosome-associated protein
LTTKKHVGTGSGEGRPRIKSSHEKVLDPGGKKPRTKAARGAPRAAAAPRPTGPRPPLPRPAGADRGRSLRKTRPEVPEPDRDGAWSMATESSRDTAAAIAVAALDKKAVGLEILDVAGKVDYADFLVIMTGRSDRHAQALAQGIEESLKKKGVRPVAVEGLPHGLWVLMDYGDVVVHVFQDEARQLYDLDGLWLDARRLPVPGGPPGTPATD